MSKFCDPDVLQPPSGFQCNGGSSPSADLRFLQVRPGAAIFDTDTIEPGSDQEDAARLFARLVTQPLPPDPLRGAALSRVAGQNLQIMTLSDTAALSLAQGAIEHSIDQRLGQPIGTDDYYQDSTVADEASLRALMNKEFNNADTIVKSTGDRPSNFTSGNYDELPGIVGGVNKLYWVIYNNLERVAALKAVQLSRATRANGVGASSLANRPINSN